MTNNLKNGIKKRYHLEYQKHYKNKDHIQMFEIDKEILELCKLLAEGEEDISSGLTEDSKDVLKELRRVLSVS